MNEEINLITNDLSYIKYENLILFLEKTNIQIKNDEECKNYNLVKFVSSFKRLPKPFLFKKTLIINEFTLLLNYYDNLKYLKTIEPENLIKEKNTLCINIDLNTISEKSIRKKIKKISKALDILENWYF